MKRMIFAACVVLLGAANSALAGASVGPADTQKTADKVRKVIDASLKGECSDLLSTMIKSACQAQLANSTPIYQKLGPLQDVSYKGVENTPNGQAMVFEASHQNGHMLWAVIEAPDGKLSTFWSPGPTQ